jgi:DNA repair exonuclease SbcCD ATPase subunit
LKEIELELSSSKDIPDSENTKNHITKTKYQKLSKSKQIYEDLKLKYDDLKVQFDEKLGAFRLEIEELETELLSYESVDEDSNLEAALLIAKYQTYNELDKEVKILRKELKLLEDSISDSEKLFSDLETYCQLTSRSGEVLKKTLDELTKTFSNSSFRFTTNKSQASGKLVTDMSVEYLVGKQWVSYPALSSGQKTLCDLYFISKVITGVGVIALDETLRFLDDENLKIAAELISDIKKQNFLLSTHSPNLSMEGISVLSCRLNSKSETEIITF